MKKSSTQRYLRLIKEIHQLDSSLFPLTVLNGMIAAAQPFVNIIFSALILDELFSTKNVSVLIQYVSIMLIGNFILSNLAHYIDHVLNNSKENIEHLLYNKVYQKALFLDYALLEKTETLEKLKMAEEGKNSRGGIYTLIRYVNICIQNIFSIFYSAVIILPIFFTSSNQASPLFRFLDSPWMLVLFLGLLMIVLYINYSVNEKDKIVFRQFEKDNIYSNRVSNYYDKVSFSDYTNGKDIRLYKMQDLFYQRMLKLSQFVFRDTCLLFFTTEGKFETIKATAFQVLNYFIYLLVALKVMFTSIAIGSLVKYTGVITQFSKSVISLINIYSEITIISEYMQHYNDFLDLPVQTSTGCLPIEKRSDNEYEIAFHDVSFTYPGQNEKALDHVSIQFKIGDKLAIVGQNGSGKTTFIKLMCRLYQPSEGVITLNGIDIQKYDYDEYIDLFSVVFQDFKLFPFALKQNISSEATCDEAKLMKILEQLGMAQRVLAMDQGIDTPLYQTQENGVEISGGEAQKLAIARALYKDAPIVILDEPTAALDPISEYEIYAHFDELVKDKSSFYISHRMSSCRFCDHIVVFDHGEIIQRGTHQVLINEDNVYAQLWNAQAKYYT